MTSICCAREPQAVLPYAHDAFFKPRRLQAGGGSAERGARHRRELEDVCCGLQEGRVPVDRGLRHRKHVPHNYSVDAHPRPCPEFVLGWTSAVSPVDR
eukprot:2676830-Pyramimonas_sp.AAC.1